MSTKSLPDIRFVNNNFKTIFTIKDGERIVMKYPTGEIKIVRCEYCDSYHFECGVTIYHILQFADICVKNHIKVLPYTDWLRKGIDCHKEGTK